MRKALAVLAAAAVALAGAGWVSAGIVYDNGPPNTTWAGYFSDFDGSFYGTPLQTADVFTLDKPAIIRDVHWWGMYVDTNTPPALDDWTIRLFDIAAGLPVVDPFYEFLAGDVGRLLTGQQTAGGYDLYEYETDILPVTVAAGTYALSIVNDTPTVVPDDWSWHNNTGIGGVSAVRNYDGEAWGPHTVEFAFHLTGDIVPEPATLSLLALGGLGLLARRRRGPRRRA